MISNIPRLLDELRRILEDNARNLLEICSNISLIYTSRFILILLCVYSYWVVACHIFKMLIQRT